MEVDKKLFSSRWTCPLSTVTSFYLRVEEENPTHRDFRITLFREMLARSWLGSRTSMHVGRPASASNNIGRLDTRRNNYGPGHSNLRWRCRLCSARGVTRTAMFKCVNCDMAPCVDRNCFADYLTQENVYDIFLSVSSADRWSLDHNLSNWTRIFTIFLETYLLHCAIRTLQHFTKPMDAVKRRNG
jgi:hypothetical protein